MSAADDRLARWVVRTVIGGLLGGSAWFGHELLGALGGLRADVAVMREDTAVIRAALVPVARPSDTPVARKD